MKHEQFNVERVADDESVKNESLRILNLNEWEVFSPEGDSVQFFNSLRETL
jgi:hypothetical protein